MSDLRRRLQAQLGGVELRESRRLERADLWGRMPEPEAPHPNDLAVYRFENGFVNVRIRDEVLLGQPVGGGTANWPRARLLQQLAERLQARPGLQVAPGCRWLWLALESLRHWHEGPRAERARLQLRQGLDRLYETRPLAGYHEKARGYPMLAQMAALGSVVSDASARPEHHEFGRAEIRVIERKRV